MVLTGLTIMKCLSGLLSLTSLSLIVVISAGCPHYGSGLPPPLRLPPLSAPVPVTGLYHTVSKDESLWGIAKAYQVDLQLLAEVNNLNAPYLIRENSRLFIPGASQKQQVEVTPVPQSQEPPRVEDYTGLLGWPAKGKVVSEFGVREGILHNGITIEAPEGSSVRSAADGKVGHTGKIPGFGNVVLIEHANRLVTVYAHLKEIRTDAGSAVRRGHIIGTVGNSGKGETPSLYFEVRSRSKPRNPAFFLSSRK